MGNLTFASFGMLVTAVMLGAFGQIFMKLGIGSHRIPIAPSVIQTVANVLQVVVKPYVLVGILLYMVSLVFWLLVISRVRLSIAYPMISMGYVVVVILSAAILREQVDWRWATTGLLCIVVGVSFIGFGLGQMGGK